MLVDARDHFAVGRGRVDDVGRRAHVIEVHTKLIRCVSGAGMLWNERGHNPSATPHGCEPK